MTPVQPKVAPTKTTVQLRELMASPKVIDCPSIYDPISARIAESLGFKCVSLEGSALGIAVCQVEAALSLEDFAKAVRAITSVINIPLIVDAGGGFGERLMCSTPFACWSMRVPRACTSKTRFFPSAFITFSTAVST